MALCTRSALLCATCSLVVASWPSIERFDVIGPPHTRHIGFRSGFALGRYGYLVPHENRGRLVRFSFDNWTHLEELDLTETDSRLAGPYGGFGIGSYAYLTAGWYGPNLFRGLIATVDVRDFRTVEVYDLQQADSGLTSFYYAWHVGGYGCTTAIGGCPKYGVAFVRFSLRNASQFERVWLPTIDTDLVGDSRSFSDGKRYSFVYFRHRSKVARIDTPNFPDASSVSVVDLAVALTLERAPPSCEWCQGKQWNITSFTKFGAGYLVLQGGYLARFALENFTTDSFQSIDLQALGFPGEVRKGFADHAYAYVLPAAYATGPMMRVDLSSFADPEPTVELASVPTGAPYFAWDGEAFVGGGHAYFSATSKHETPNGTTLFGPIFRFSVKPTRCRSAPKEISILYKAESCSAEP